MHGSGLRHVGDAMSVGNSRSRSKPVIERSVIRAGWEMPVRAEVCQQRCAGSVGRYTSGQTQSRGGGECFSRTGFARLEATQSAPLSYKLISPSLHNFLSYFFLLITLAIIFKAIKT